MRKGYEQAHADDLHFARLRGRIQRVYAQAESELTKKIEQFTKRYEAQDKIKREQLKNGEITQQQYESWLRGQVFRGERWQSVKQSAVDQIYRANKTATGLMNNERKALFQDGANYSAFQIEKGTHGAISFDIYDNATVTRLLKNDPKMLPDLKLGKRKDESWNGRGIQNAITQGIIQGESIPQIAKRIGQETGERNRKAMTRQARTAMTGAQNAGRMAAMRDAKEMGIRVKKKWIATLDSKTRDTHAELDGQEVDEDQPFVVNGMEIMYPGDPNAAPSLVYNCRCTLGWVYPDYPASGQRRDNETGEIIDDVTYREWEKGKQKVDDSPEIKSTIVQGQDITETWTRRPEQFAYAIEDVINAQGFDGKPKVVDADEFNKIAKKNKFLAQRGYIAPNKETLDAYREQLYNGKWYVDCSRGGSMYGQGMYAGANFVGEMTDGVKRVSDAYSGNGFGYVETFTMENPKFVSFTDMQREYNGGFSERSREKLYSSLTNDEQLFLDINAHAFFPERSAPDWQEASEAAVRLGEKGRETVLQRFASALQEAQDRATMIKEKYDDIGAYDAACGYDGMICGREDEDGVYVVILNRTKCVFRRP